MIICVFPLSQDNMHRNNVSFESTRENEAKQTEDFNNPPLELDLGSQIIPSEGALIVESKQVTMINEQQTETYSTCKSPRRF